MGSFPQTLSATGRFADFFYWVRAENNNIVSLFSGSDAGRLADIPAVYQPGLTIRKKLSQRIGDGTYNSSGKGQRSTAATRGRLVNYKPQVQNDGDSPDVFVLRGISKNSKWDVKHFRLSGGRLNVSATVRTGLHETGAIAPGENVLYEIRVKPKRRTKKKRASFKAGFQGESTNGGQLDQLVTLTKNRP